MSEWHYSKNGNASGPVDGATLKRLARDGELLRTDLVWKEGMANWLPALRVKGLFDATPPASATAAPMTTASAPQPPASLAYASPRTGNEALPAEVRPRSPIPFTIIAALMFASGLVVAYQAYFLSGSAQDVLVSVIGTCGFLVLAIPALVLWMVWIFGVHRDVRTLTHGQYTISPGKAVGFSFIPLFDAFWACYMPYSLTHEINRHLRQHGKTLIPTGLVLACQIASVLLAFFLPGFLPVLYAITMWLVQSGMNRLIGRG